jgi:hypothetical protein
MSRQRTVTQIDAKARRLLAGLVASVIVLRRGEGRGVNYEPARSGKRTPVLGSQPPDFVWRTSGLRKSKDKKGSV